MSALSQGSRLRLLPSLLAITVLCVLVGAAASAQAAPWWHLTSSGFPASLTAGAEGTVTVRAVNVGDGATAGDVKLSLVLPAHVKVVEKENFLSELVPQVSLFAFSVQGGAFDLGNGGFVGNDKACEVVGATVSCDTSKIPVGFGLADWPAVHPYEDLEIRVVVRAEAGAESGGRAEVSGGGLAAVSLGEPVKLGATAAGFGVSEFAMVPEEVGGGVDAQAGSHPFQFTTTFALNQSADPTRPVALARNLRFGLPVGLVGNATALPQCSELDFASVPPAEAGSNLCSADTAIGVAALTFDEPLTLHLRTVPVPLFNLTPGRGEPARFGFELFHTPVVLDTAVRTGSDYGVTVNVSNISQLVNFISSTVTFWGVPGDQAHDESRGWTCLAAEHWLKEEDRGTGKCVATHVSNPPPFLTLPTSCAAPFAPTVEGDSWPIKANPQAVATSVRFPGQTYLLQDSFGRGLGITGCNQLPFAPQIEVAPDVQSASTPTGLTVHVRVPQEVNQNAGGLSSSNVRNITVELPEGVTLNPAGAGGLESCTSNPGEQPDTAGNEIGFKGSAELDPLGEPGAQTLQFDPALPEPLSPGLELGAHGFCPNASKVGTVKITSPLIPNPVVGSVYLASQNANPFGSLVAMYIVAEDPVSGTIVKLPGRLWLCKRTGEVLAGETCGVPGQIVSTFEDQPQLPFEDAEIHFFGGERAPLSTPAFCRDETPAHPGNYTTNASFTGWAGNEPVTSQSHFNITSGPGGGPCPGASLPFSPSLTGGTTNINAGGFTPLTTTIGRPDGNQDMRSVTLQMPQGLTGILTGVKLCPEAQANEGLCPAESQIGETTVQAGVGQQPVFVKGGKVYLTEKYAGAPFGLSIVDPVKTGPFDLEHDTANPAQNPACDCVVVRAKIEVDPVTAALTITTDPTGAHAIPNLIDGIPVQIQKVNVLINRPGFTFNPTSCDPMSITGTIAGAEGATSPVSVPFQATNCASLAFKPGFAVSTSGKTSKANGASLAVKLTYPSAPVGSQANIKQVKVELPKALPSRLTTLQKACTAAQFNSNPAGCPAASVIGHAKAVTPLLPVPLEGPAYFVSHGGEAFPSLIIVLQGYGVTLDLVGTTFISKTGITSSTFKTVPDAPVGSFELTLPQGKFSALAANGDLCASKLTMPTEFLAQNGAKINQSTSVSVTGCAKKKALTRAQKLAKALKACKRKARGKRAACIADAHRKYGPAKRTKKKKK